MPISWQAMRVVVVGCTDGTIRLLDERPRLGCMGEVWLGWRLRRCVPSLFLCLKYLLTYIIVVVPLSLMTCADRGEVLRVLKRREVRRWHGCHSRCSPLPSSVNIVIFSLGRCTVGGGGRTGVASNCADAWEIPPIFFQKPGNRRLAGHVHTQT